MTQSTCKDCGTDITHRGRAAQRCEPCAQNRIRELNRQSDQRRYDRTFRKGVMKCSDCGGPAARDKNRHRELGLCTTCANRRRKVWTRDAIINAIQEFAAEYGRTPGAQDWNVAMARHNGRFDLALRYTTDTRWPPTTSVYGQRKPFASWNDAITAAGLTPRKPGQRGPESDYSRLTKGRIEAPHYCGHGHPYTTENTYIPPGSNRRQCRECTRLRQRAHYHRKRISA